MATNTNLSSSSAALNVNEEKCEKADFGPGEDKEKEKGNVAVLLDPNLFGQEEKEERK